MKFLNILFLYVFFSNVMFADEDNEILNLNRLIISGTSSLEEISKEIERLSNTGPLKLTKEIRSKMLKIIKSNLKNPSALLATKVELFNILNASVKSSGFNKLKGMEIVEILYYMSLYDITIGTAEDFMFYFKMFDSSVTELLASDISEIEKTKMAYYVSMLKICKNMANQESVSPLITENMDLQKYNDDAFSKKVEEVFEVLSRFLVADETEASSEDDLLTQKLDKFSGEELSFILKLLTTSSLGLNGEASFLFKTSSIRFLYFLKNEQSLNLEAKMLLPVYAFMTDLESGSKETKSSFSIFLDDVSSKDNPKKYFGKPLKNYFEILSKKKPSIIFGFNKQIFEKTGVLVFTLSPEDELSLLLDILKNSEIASDRAVNKFFEIINKYPKTLPTEVFQNGTLDKMLNYFLATCQYDISEVEETDKTEMLSTFFSDLNLFLGADTNGNAEKFKVMITDKIVKNIIINSNFDINLIDNIYKDLINLNEFYSYMYSDVINGIVQVYNKLIAGELTSSNKTQAEIDKWYENINYNAGNSKGNTIDFDFYFEKRKKEKRAEEIIIRARSKIFDVSITNLIDYIESVLGAKDKTSVDGEEFLTRLSFIKADSFLTRVEFMTIRNMLNLLDAEYKNKIIELDWYKKNKALIFFSAVGTNQKSAELIREETLKKFKLEEELAKKQKAAEVEPPKQKGELVISVDVQKLLLTQNNPSIFIQKVNIFIVNPKNVLNIYEIEALINGIELISSKVENNIPSEIFANLGARVEVLNYINEKILFNRTKTDGDKIVFFNARVKELQAEIEKGEYKNPFDNIKNEIKKVLETIAKTKKIK